MVAVLPMAGGLPVYDSSAVTAVVTQTRSSSVVECQQTRGNRSIVGDGQTRCIRETSGSGTRQDVGNNEVVVAAEIIGGNGLTYELVEISFIVAIVFFLASRCSHQEQ
jgi:hypothetical protein